jgi:hypothetical protein
VQGRSNPARWTAALPRNGNCKPHWYTSLRAFYDRGQLSADERDLLRTCAWQHSSSGPVGLLSAPVPATFYLSDDPRLFELAGWPARIGGRGEVEQQNDQHLRTPMPMN